MPPLVTRAECGLLSGAVARVAQGGGFLLQGGDCAERFCESGPAEVRAKLAQLYGLAEAIRSATGSVTVPLGRLAGQYGKPRSAPYEHTADGTVVPSYRGDAARPRRSRSGHRPRCRTTVRRVTPV